MSIIKFILGWCGFLSGRAAIYGICLCLDTRTRMDKKNTAKVAIAFLGISAACITLAVMLK